jgi:pimeloyl-ACP methyl ester carboxylesterase
MNQIKNIKIEGKNGKPVLLDASWKGDKTKKPIVIFAHGFKGFKDWGTWEAIGAQIVEAGFIFIKFNFSHNGTTPEKPLEFGNLEAFGENNYEIELNDLSVVLDWIDNQNIIDDSIINKEKISLIGHSRGGGVAIIKAYEDQRIKNLITWASVETLDWMFKPEMVENWQTKGVHIIKNGRTKQEMPLYYQLYENFEKNKIRFDIKKALQNLNKPHLIIQGTEDPAIPVTAAEAHKRWNQNAKLILIEGANHVFGGGHPFEKERLPKHTESLLTATIDFLKAKK